MSLFISPYSDKSFVVRGEGTKEHKQELKDNGGRWNTSLKVPDIKSTTGETEPGWIFSNKRLVAVTDLVNDNKPLVSVVKVNKPVEVKTSRKRQASLSPDARPKTKTKTNTKTKVEFDYDPEAIRRGMSFFFIIWFVSVVVLWYFADRNLSEEFENIYSERSEDISIFFRNLFTSPGTSSTDSWGYYTAPLNFTYEPYEGLFL
jgi:hypothetical protein